MSKYRSEEGRDGEMRVSKCSRPEPTAECRRYWVALLPPSEGSPSRDNCSVPPDSPLTPFNETSLLDQSMGYRGCNDYAGWSDIVGRLGKLYPALVALGAPDRKP